MRARGSPDRQLVEARPAAVVRQPPLLRDADGHVVHDIGLHPDLRPCSV
jgi:hypothetical protein